MNYETIKNTKFGLVALFFLLITFSCNKEENVVPNIVQETYEDSKDEVCNMINGKLECVAKRLKNNVKDATK